MGFTLGLPPGLYVPDRPEINDLVEKIRPLNGLILPSAVASLEPLARQNVRKVVTVTNLPLEISTEEIGNLIASNMLKHKLTAETNPVVSCEIHKTRIHARVEFRSQKLAEAAVQLGSVLVGTHALQIMWPVSRREKTEAALSDYFNSRDTNDCIFIDSLLPLPNIDVLAQAIEQSFKIDSIERPDGFNHCTLRLSDPQLLSSAIFQLNDSLVDGVKLRVRRAFVDCDQPPRNLNAKELRKMTTTSGPSTMFTVVSPLMRSKPCVADILNMEVPVSFAIRPETERLEPSTGLALHIFNIAPLVALYDNEVCQDLIMDIREECNKFGRVIDCVVAKLASESLPSDYSIVKVLFDNKEDAKQAQMGISGRRYCGRLVITMLV
jgi:hypothetical protein